MKKMIGRMCAFATSLVLTICALVVNSHDLLHAEAADKGVKINREYVFFCSELVGFACCPKDYVLDIKGGKTTNGTNCQLYSYNGTASQCFRLIYGGKDANGYYYSFERYGTNSVLDINHGNVKNGTNIELYKYHGGRNQQFYLTPAGNNRYYIRSRLNFNYVLDVTGGNAKNGTNIQLYKINYTASQRFGFSSSIRYVAQHKPGKLHSVLVNNKEGDMIWVLGRECKVCGAVYSGSSWVLPNQD